MAERHPHCLRCKTPELVPLDSPAKTTFFECPECRRQYTQKAGGGLTFRWLHPISLYLYPMIFKTDPVKYFEQIKGAFDGPTAATPESLAKDKRAFQEIMLELDDPTQHVRDILGCCASEEELRKYLRCVADVLKKRIDATEQNGRDSTTTELLPPEF